MKKRTFLSFFVLVFVIFIVAFFFYQKNRGEDIPFQTISGYFVRNDIPLDDDFNYFIIENKDEAESILGIAKTMDNEVTEVDFDSELMLVIATPSADRNDNIAINFVKLINNSIYVDFSYKKGEKRSFSIIPSAIIAVKKPYQLFDLYLSKDGYNKEKIALGRRVLNSPGSYTDLKENYTGTFKGEIPCADCEGIEMTLHLNADNSYELFSLYKGKSSIPFKEEGAWVPSEDLSMVELMESRTYFFLDGEDVVELLDANAKHINSDLNYRLVRK